MCEHAVQWRLGTEQDAKEMVSDVQVQVDVVKPGWLVVPNAAIRSTGNAVIGTILSAAIPRFLAQLEKDYAAWATGDESRQPLGTGEML
jgi:hypothetical protein